MPGAHDDDLLPDLPPIGDAEEEELPDGQELGLDEDELARLPSDEPPVGLDDSTGLDDEAALFDLDLPADEDGLVDAEGPEGDFEILAPEELDSEGEYGWTDAGGADDRDEPWDPADTDLPSLVPLSTEDGGEVGLDEEELGLEGDDDALPGLPRLEDGGEEEDETADDLLLGEESGVGADAARSFDHERLQMGEGLPPPLESAVCAVEYLGPGDDEVYALGLSEPPLAGGGRLYRIADRCEPIESTGLEDQEVVSIVRIDADILVVGTRLRGPLRSEDGGSTFRAVHGVGSAHVAQSFYVHAEASGGRLWGRTGSGALYRSEDGGRSWVGPLLLKPALAIATPSEGGVVALCAGRDAPPQLVGSEDGGERWAAVDGPPWPEVAPKGELNLVVCGERVALASDQDTAGPFLSSDGGRSWARFPGLPPTGPMALVREAGGISLYAAHYFESADRGVLVRHRPDGGEARLVLDVAEQARALGLGGAGSADGARRIHAVEAVPEGPGSSLYVATGAGLFRVRVRSDEMS